MFPFKAKAKRPPIKYTRFFWVCFDALIQEAAFMNAKRNQEEGKGLVMDAGVSLYLDVVSSMIRRLIESTPREPNEPVIMRVTDVTVQAGCNHGGGCPPQN